MAELALGRVAPGRGRDLALAPELLGVGLHAAQDLAHHLSELVGGSEHLSGRDTHLVIDDISVRQ